MSDQTQIYDNITPLIPSGGTPVSITVDQTFSVPVTLTGTKKIQIQVTGPQITLTESDIDSVYPAPGSTDSPDEFLPHIAVRRRTLPWERSGTAANQPWLVLLLLKSSELQGTTGGISTGGINVGDLVNQQIKAQALIAKDVPIGPKVTNTIPVKNVAPLINANLSDSVKNVAAKPIVATQVLSPAQVAVAAAGSYFPHLTLTRPAVVDGKVGDVKNRDSAGYAKMVATGLTDATAVNLLFLRNSVFASACPLANEIPYLCHARRTSKNNVNEDHAIVVSARLPDASQNPPELHTAFLVSLENRSDAFAPDRAAKPNSEIGLIVLHSWNFTPSKGGDFEEVMKSIPIRPNGGVLRFGNLPADVPAGKTAPLTPSFDGLLDTHGNFVDPLPHTQPGNATYRGPFLPFPAPARSAGFAVRSAPEEFKTGAKTALPQDYSYAAAFELGRLLAIGNQDVLEDLRAVHAVPPKPTDRQFIQLNLLPIALQKKDWVTNPVLEQTNPWDMVANNSVVQLVKDANQFASLGIADITGVAQQATQFNAVQGQLGAIGAPAVMQVSQIDINSIGSIDLEKTFANVVIKAQP